MTSSLVGSEMCIRDRMKLSQTIAATCWAASLEQELMLGNDTKAYEFFPVSYTHLTLPTICSV
eukprot:1807541-Prorocentrum_lima.AAC.1